MLYFDYDGNDIDKIIKDANEDLFDDFVYYHKLKMETDADKALAIALYANQITYILIDKLDVHPEEVNHG